MTRLDLDRLRSDLTQHAEVVAIALLGKPNDRNRKELRFGRKQEILVTIAGNKAGLWHDFYDGDGGDLIALIQRERNCDFRRACEFASDLIGGRYDTEAPRPRPERATTASTSSTSSWISNKALELFREAHPIDGTLGERYLVETRRIRFDELPVLTGVIRFHPECVFGDDRVPCILALFRHIVSNAPTAVQRIALSASASKIGSKTLGPMRGSVIKIFADETVERALVIGEGLETCLSAATIAYRGTLLRPIWATGGTGNMKNFPVLSGVDTLTIIVDHDQRDPRTGRYPGQDAARECAQHWQAAGCEVVRLMPNALGEDFNDVLRGGA
jgi:hypothetical protein